MYVNYSGVFMTFKRKGVNFVKKWLKQYNLSFSNYSETSISQNKCRTLAFAFYLT